MSKKKKNKGQQNNNSNAWQDEFLKTIGLENVQKKNDDLKTEHSDTEVKDREEIIKSEDLIKLKLEYTNKEAKRIIENAQEEAIKIKKQAEFEVENLLENTAREAKRAIRNAQENARKIQKQAEYDAEDLREASAKEVKKIIRNAQEEATKIKKQVESDCEDIKENAYNKADEIVKNAYDEAKTVWQKGHSAFKNQQETIQNLELEHQEDRYELKEQQENIQNQLQKQQQNLEIKPKNIDFFEKLNSIVDSEPFIWLKKELESEQEKYKNLYEQQTKILKEYQLCRDKCEQFEKIYKEYSEYEQIEALKKKADQVDILERERNFLEEQIKHYQETQSNEDNLEDLEVIKKQIDSTNKYQENLLQKLESIKIVLENHTGDSCPSLSKVDIETEEEKFKEDIAERRKREKLFKLQDIVSHIKNYAGSHNLYYTDNDIRAFLAGMAASRLIILQGMSGTGKSSLPRIFAEAISGFNRLIPVESSWRDRNELLGYFNDFSKKFNAKSFTIELYRSSKRVCQEIPTFITLDEMHLAHMEYYFSDFLSILEVPESENWLIDLVSSDMRTLPMELSKNVEENMKKDFPFIYNIWENLQKRRGGDWKVTISDEQEKKLFDYLAKLNELIGAKELEEGRKIKVTKNIWFVGTSNKDESTFEITDKVYDRAQVISLNEKGKPETYKDPAQKYISVTDLLKRFEDAIKNNAVKKEVEKKLNELDDCLKKKFYTSFGNRIVKQTIDFVAVFMATGGTLEDALDYQISNKIVRKVITSDDTESLYELIAIVDDYPKTRQLIEKRINELEKFL